MVESGSSSSDEDAFLSAAEELTPSPTPHNYESPETGDLVEEGGGNGNLYNDDGDVQTVSNVNTAGSETSDEEHVYDNRGAKFLMKLDQNFLESPRLLMAGVWRSKEFELQVKRKATGLNVQWLLTNRQDKRIVLNSIATMTYKSGHPLSIKYDSEPRAFGYAVKGGWAWNGYGYGFVNLNRINRYQENLFPLSDSSIKHIDLEEAVFPEESVQHHICGDTCINIDKNVNIECKEDGCGLEISRLSVQSFSTTVHKPGSWELPHNYKRLHLKEQVSFSLVVFPSSAEYKVLFHMDGKEVAWMRKVEDVSYDHQPIVDHCIMEKHQYIWRTESPGAAIKRSLCISETENEQQNGSIARKAEESYVHQEVAPVSDMNLCRRETYEGDNDRGRAGQAGDPQPDIDPLYDLQRALVESRKTGRQGMTGKEMIEVAIKFMARLGVKCDYPASFIPPDGDCLWSSIVRFLSPFLKDFLFISLL